MWKQVGRNSNNNVCIQICAAKVKLGRKRGAQTPKKCRKVCHKNISTQPRAENQAQPKTITHGESTAAVRFVVGSKIIFKSILIFLTFLVIVEPNKYFNFHFLI